jgi:hypothetical protein
MFRMVAVCDGKRRAWDGGEADIDDDANEHTQQKRLSL